jgi:hypothetical protein
LGPAWKSGRVVQGFRACVLVHFEKQKKKESPLACPETAGKEK